MIDLKKNADLFGNPDSITVFAELVKKLLEEAGPNPVPVYFEGKLLGFLVNPKE